MDAAKILIGPGHRTDVGWRPGLWRGYGHRDPPLRNPEGGPGAMLRTSVHLLRDRDLRSFFTAWGASSIGAGGGYVALLFAVQQEFGAGWAVGAVLLAQFAHAMLFGVALGAQVDRRSRRRCALFADALGAIAFVALAFAAPLPLIIALSAVAGFGTAIAGPAHMALLPRLARDE